MTSRADSVRHALRLWDVLIGRISLVGPRPVPIEELTARSAALCHGNTPGLVCLHWLRWRSNIAFVPESVSDREYLDSASLRADLSILARALLVSIYGKQAIETGKSTEVLGIHIDNLTMTEALNSIDTAIELETTGTQVAFVNADCLNRATQDVRYRTSLASATLVLADGIGIRIAGSVLSRPIRQNVNGTDMFPLLCKRLNKGCRSIFLLGARPEVVAALVDRIQREYPHIAICGTENGYFTDEAAIVAQVAKAAPDVLFVALGAPAQEAFISRNRLQLGAKVCIGVGGLFDFYSGRIPRAPQWLREAGLEWVFRLCQEPGRMWRRYLVGNVVFLMRVVAERCGVSYSHQRTAVIR
jgi:N-acetylglucosaminyldiphosphoundecaprenol N-acetyl-beta-D-mannosaminyltransferase